MEMLILYIISKILQLLLWLLYYVIITTMINSIVMGVLHFVPVVGYDEDYIFVAESLKELVNCNERYYNRKIAVGEFQKLWNTSMWKM